MGKKSMTDRNKIKRYIRLDQLFRDDAGHTISEILSDPDVDYISDRSLRENLKEFEDSFGAPFDTQAYRGRERLWKYKDPNFSIFQQINQDIEIIQKSIQQLKLLQGDPQYDALRFSLMDLKGIIAGEKPFMSFDSNKDLKGLEHIESIADAIRHQYPIKLWYKPYNQPEAIHHVHPYHLRQFNNRWFLLAYCEESKAIYNYPIDRIKQIDHLSKEYIPTDIDFDEYFDDIVGVTNYQENTVQEILLRVDKKSIDYIRTKPFHATQRELKEREKEHSVVLSLEVKENTELIMLLLSYGDAIEVIAPLSLRQKMKEIIQKLGSFYEV